MSKPHLVRTTFHSCCADGIEGHSAYGPTPDIRQPLLMAFTQVFDGLLMEIRSKIKEYRVSIV
jgi:hypothetical protein